jgi:hypothetical protein
MLGKNYIGCSTVPLRGTFGVFCRVLQNSLNAIFTFPFNKLQVSSHFGTRLAYLACRNLELNKGYAMKRILGLTILIVAFAMVGCGKKEERAPQAPTAPTGPREDNQPPAGNYEDDPDAAYGDLILDSQAVFEEYLGRPANTNSNHKIKFELFRVGQDSQGRSVYGGKVYIQYTELDFNGTPQVKHNPFDAGTSVFNAKYNRWTEETVPHFKAFFEDPYGALTVVIDETGDLESWSGEVFFKNWDLDRCDTQWWLPGCYKKSPTKCWHIKTGPYDCRDYLVNNNIDLESQTYPSRYIRLGRFENLDGSKALGEE